MIHINHCGICFLIQFKINFILRTDQHLVIFGYINQSGSTSLVCLRVFHWLLWGNAHINKFSNGFQSHGLALVGDYLDYSFSCDVTSKTKRLVKMLFVSCFIISRLFFREFETVFLLCSSCRFHFCIKNDFVMYSFVFTSPVTSWLFMTTINTAKLLPSSQRP